MRNPLLGTRGNLDSVRTAWTIASMSDRDRRTRLLELVRATGTASVDELSRTLDVTPSTIRRDLQRLSATGRVIRSYGGAKAAGSRDDAAPTVPRFLTEKRRVAAAAAGLVHDGQTIAISSGSTALEFARQLVDRTDLTVITNSLDVAQVLVDRDGIQLVVLGGVVRPRMHSLLGHLTEGATRELRADTLFMGIGAISLERGFMNDYMPEIVTDRAVRSMATTIVVMADSTKFDHVAPALVFGFDAVDVIVTDAAINEAIVEELRSKGIRVVVA
jgi:DeoR family transcriptional regulator of aga operon